MSYSMGCRSCSDKTGAVYARQLTHSLDAQVALHRHQLSDLVVDAVSPAGLLLWRRAPTFCKAPLKKSASSVLSATSRFSCATCCRSSRSFEFSGGPLSVVNRLPLITLLVQQQPMHAQFCRKRDDVIALLQPLDRHLPECLGISTNPPLRFATRSPFLCKVCQMRLSQFWVQSSPSSSARSRERRY
jgi:hypothetical protein